MSARATLALEPLVQQRRHWRAARTASDPEAQADALAAAMECGARAGEVAEAELAEREKGAAA